jgi:ABC-type multidrug transport system ATPase subunit
MTISLSDAGKRYNRDWIFRHINFSFTSGQAYAITGPNGSGKSTLLQALSGGLLLSEGSIRFEQNGKTISDEAIYQQVSICAPYVELVEEMTLLEFLDFHFGFKSYLPGLDARRVIELVGLEKSVRKQIRYYSSGMKQRVKLAQCLFSDTAIVLLDEPCTNLDAAGIELYHSLIRDFTPGRLVAVSSNDEVEYRFCTERLHISDYK